MINHLGGFRRALAVSACCSVFIAAVLAGCNGAVSSSGQRTATAEGADLVVTAASISHQSPSPGANVTLSVTVRNTGTQAAGATTVRIYQSADTTISTSDTEVGQGDIAALAASVSTTAAVLLTAPATGGTFYYGACIDAVVGETDNTNNCSASVQVTVGSAAALQGRPDLLVVSPSVSDGSPAAGARFTLSASVANGGGGSSAATTLRFYRSADAAVSASDTAVGTAEVAALSGSGSTTASVQLTAPTTPGTFYFGACVAAVADEADDTNNCSTSVRITVQEPDLVVGLPTVSNDGPVVGAAFVLTATVSNNGTGPAAATTLRYYRSDDDTISTSDTELGSAAVAALAGSGSSSQSVDLTAPATPGTFYYGACVDPVADESDTANNCSSAVAVMVQQTVTVAKGDPDLTVPDAFVNDGEPAAGARFRLSATARNDGEGEAETTMLRFFRSTDATITPADTEVGTDGIAVLAAAGSAGQSVDLTAPSTPGTYYYGACVDAVSGETNTTNNCSTAVTVTVPQPPRPDLTVAQPSVTDSGPATGGPFVLSATVSNGGTGNSAATTLRYYRSADATVTDADTQVGTDRIAELAAAGSAGHSVDLTAPSTPGTYYYGACVDAVSGETDTTNNCSPTVTVTILQPDLVAESPAVSKNSPEAGAQFTLSVSITNDGEGESDATTLRYYSSTDTGISTSDTEVGTDSVAALAAAGTSQQSIDLTAPDTAGTYHYGACVDVVADESDTANNCSAAVTVTVPETERSEATVEVSAEDDQEWAPVGDQVDLSARVLDDGGEEITGASVSWSSDDTTVATVDSSGVMTAVGEGTATLTATATLSSSSTQSAAFRLSASSGTVVKSEQTVFASIEMVVVRRASRVEVSPDSLSFDSVGQIKSLTATVYDENDAVMEPWYLVWSSDDTDVVSVPRGSEGSVRAIAEGTTTVSVTANASATGTADVTVTLPAARVTASPKSLTFASLGLSESVTIKAFDENGDEDQDATISWSVDETPDLTGVPPGTQDIFVIKVESATGGLKVTAEGNGSASVTVSSGDLEPALFLVNVLQKEASIELAPSSNNLHVDGTATLSASVKDANGHSIPIWNGATSGLVTVFWSTSDLGVATVTGSAYSTTTTSSGETRIDNEGATATVTGIAAGNATITGSVTSGAQDIISTATVTVTDSN